MSALSPHVLTMEPVKILWVRLIATVVTDGVGLHVIKTSMNALCFLVSIMELV